MSPSRMAPRVVLLLVALAGVALCLTVLFLSMRAVMDIGGSCASGGPYQIARPCPEGIAWTTPVSVLAGIVFAAVYVFAAIGLGLGDGLAILFWSALFGSLGWNFLEYALDPPGADDGVVWGWLIPGILFWLIAAPPLFVLLPRRWRGSLWAPPVQGFPRARRGGGAPPDAPRSAPEPEPVGAADDIVARLERLAALRARGAIDADEYERAKDAVLRGAG